MSEAIGELEEALEYRFRDGELLSCALTHKSRAADREAAPQFCDNERLEFLGDSILGFLVSERLLELFPGAPEGVLSKRKSRLVSETHLHTVARSLSLGRHLILGRTEQVNGGREKKTLLADAVEALIAALYLDGGMEAARRFVLAQVAQDAAEGDGEPEAADHKSALQELAQALKLPHPRYSVLETHGPDHAKTFLVEVRIGGAWAARAEGQSKKSASQEAARRVIERIEAARAAGLLP